MNIVILLVAVILLSAAVAAVSGAPWVPAFKRDLEKVLDDAKLRKGQRFIEMGSGDGRLLVAAAKRGASVTGYEINPLLFVISWLRLLKYRGHAKVYLKDFWGVDLSQADVVLAFLVPRTTPKLYRKAKLEMKPGSRLISYIFDVPGVKASLSRHHWHIYKF